MNREFGQAPSLDEIEALARAAMARLPELFSSHLADIVLRVEDFADDETLAELGIEEAFELTGVYEGLPLGQKEGGAVAAMPDRIQIGRASCRERVCT